MVKSYRLSYLIDSGAKEGNEGLLRQVNRVIVEFIFGRSKKTRRIEIPIQNTTESQSESELAFGFFMRTTGGMKYRSASNLFNSTRVTRGLGCTNPSQTSLRKSNDPTGFFLTVFVRSLTAPKMDEELPRRTILNCDVQFPSFLRPLQM